MIVVSWSDCVQSFLYPVGEPEGNPNEGYEAPRVAFRSRAWHRNPVAFSLSIDT